MKHHVELCESFTTSLDAILPVVYDILAAISEGQAPYAPLSLTVNLKDVKGSLPVTISMPVHLSMKPTMRNPPWRFDIQLKAEDHKSMFPAFTGWITASPTGTSSGELWMMGDYEPPMGLLGENLNATVMSGVAEQSLQSFLHWLKDTAVDRLNKQEAEQTRYRFHQ